MTEAAEEKTIEPKPNLTKSTEVGKRGEQDSREPAKVKTTSSADGKTPDSESVENKCQEKPPASNNSKLLPLVPFMLIIGTVLIVLMAIIDTAIIQGQSPQPFRSIAYIDGIILLASLTLLEIVLSIYKGARFAIVGCVLLALLFAAFVGALKFA